MIDCSSPRVSRAWSQCSAPLQVTPCQCVAARELTPCTIRLLQWLHASGASTRAHVCHVSIHSLVHTYPRALPGIKTPLRHKYVAEANSVCSPKCCNCSPQTRLLKERHEPPGSTPGRFHAQPCPDSARAAVRNGFALPAPVQAGTFSLSLPPEGVLGATSREDVRSDFVHLLCVLPGWP